MGRTTRGFVVGAALFISAGSARADLVQSCVTCSASNPLTLVSGGVTASAGDGEAVTSDGNAIQWGSNFTNNLLGGNLVATASFPPPDLSTDVVSGQAQATLFVGAPYTLPAIKLDASSNNSSPYAPFGGASASGSLIYQVEVIRAGQAATYGLPAGTVTCGTTACLPATADPVDGTPVLVDVHGLISGTGPSQLDGTTSGASGSGDIILTRDSDDSLIVKTTTFGMFNPIISLQVGTVYNVQLDASLDVFSSGAGSVLVDPAFSVDPSDPNYGDLTFLFSNGLNVPEGAQAGLNPSLVPEPRSVLLLAAALGLMHLLTSARPRHGDHEEVCGAHAVAGALRCGSDQDETRPTS